MGYDTSASYWYDLNLDILDADNKDVTFFGIVLDVENAAFPNLSTFRDGFHYHTYFGKCS